MLVIKQMKTTKTIKTKQKIKKIDNFLNKLKNFNKEIYFIKFN